MTDAQRPTDARRRSHRNAVARTLVIEACLQRLELVFELLQGATTRMGLGGLQVEERLIHERVVAGFEGLQDFAGLIIDVAIRMMEELEHFFLAELGAKLLKSRADRPALRRRLW